MTANTPMDIALEEAAKAAALGEVPVGAVVLDPAGHVVSRAHNLTRSTNDPTAHAEVVAIRAAAQILCQDRLQGCVLYVTLEPCAMCAGAIAHARIKRVVYGAADPKSGGTDHGAKVFHHPQTHHKPEVISGVGERKSASLLQTFFLKKR